MRNSMDAVQELPGEPGDYVIPEPAEIVIKPDGPGFVAVISYKDHHIASGRQKSKKAALKVLARLAMEMWVNA
jgi:hypothetical protein